MARNNQNKTDLWIRGKIHRRLKLLTTKCKSVSSEHKTRSVLKAKAFTTNISDHNLFDNEILAIGYGLDIST